jgi:hypothetical protein
MELKDIDSLLSRIRDLNTSFYTGTSGYTDFTSYLEEQRRKYIADNNYLKYYNWDIFPEIEFKNIKFI